jgi:hypothetical protein
LISCAIEALVWRALRLRVKFATKAARSRYATATGHQQLSLAETDCAVRFRRSGYRSADAPATISGDASGREIQSPLDENRRDTREG